MYYTGEIRAFKNKLVYQTSTYNFVVLGSDASGKKIVHSVLNPIMLIYEGKKNFIFEIELLRFQEFF